MPIAGTFTLTGTYEQLGGAPAAGIAQIDGIPNVIVDGAGNKVKVGPKKPTLDTAGTFTITLPTDVSTGTSTTLGYRVTARLKHNNLDPVEFYAPAAGTTLDVADLTPMTVEPVSVSGANAAAAAASAATAQSAATAAQAVGTTNDTVIAGQVNSTTSATRSAISALIGDRTEGQRMALIGDSRVALVTAPAGFSSNGLTYINDDRSWWHWAQIALGQRFDYVSNTSVGGTTTTQHVASQLAGAVASPATHVLHWGFLNDMGASVNPDPAVTIANLQSIYDSIRASGKTVIAVTDYLQPAQSDARQIAACAKVNAFIRSYARTHARVILWDAAALLVDPDTGYIRATYAIDGTHPNKKSSMILGQSLAQLLSNRTSPLSPLVTTSNDPYNLVGNGLLIGGSTPTGWASTNGAGGTAPATITRVSRTDGGPGYLWQVALNATGSDTGKAVAYWAQTTGLPAISGHTVIPRLYFETGVQGGALDWSNIDHFYAYAQFIGATTVSSYTIYPGSDTAVLNAAEMPRSGIMQGPPITVPTGLTRINFFVELATPAAAAGVGTVRIGQAEIHDLTACGY